ncbi:MAG TPA: TadE/TadG family type IV pilus assembly protein [Methylobacterium sp.]
MTHLSALRRNDDGSVVLIFALLVPILMGLSAVALEYGSLVKRRTELQRAADSGAIAGVNQFKLANTEDAAAVNTAIAMSRAQAQTDAPADRTTAVEAVVGSKRASVQVTVRETVPLSFGKFLNMANVEISAQSTARLAGTTRLCLLALDPKAKKAFSAEKNARIAAPDCSIYSNSKSQEGISAGDGAVATALTMCSAGGYKGTSANFVPPPATECPPLKDPLADRPAPPIGGCVSLGSINVNNADSTKTVKLAKGAYTLSPGTYCNGLEITDEALVTLNPGVYVMKNGPLVVKKKASMTGENVGFYFMGDKGGLLFDKDSIVSLTAPKDGDMQSLLFFEERSVANPAPPPEPDGVLGTVLAPLAPETDQPLRQYRILSDNTRTLLGTIYLPAGRLIIDAKKPVADQSTYTVVVARLVNLYEGPNLILNARYANSDIPVPEGVGPSSADTVISQ